MPIPSAPRPAGDPADSAADRRRGLEARRRNERLKLTAGAVDRLSTVIFGGAVLAPVFQQQPFIWWKIGGWFLAGTVLHIIAHYIVGFLKEDEL